MEDELWENPAARAISEFLRLEQDEAKIRTTTIGERVAVDSDELARLIEEDERLDAADSGLMTPIDYAKLRGIFPQKVYKAIKLGKLPSYRCQCGRRIINVKEADTLFKLGEQHEQTTADDE